MSIALATRALLGLLVRDATLSIRPRCLPDEALRRRVQARYELALEGTRVSVDGVEQPSGERAPYATGGTVELVLAEQTRGCVEGELTRLLRVYEHVASERWEGVGEERERWSEESALAGARVRFEREGGTWSARWADPQREGEPPRGLHASLALEALAPASPVAVGSSWEVPADALRVLLEPWRGIPFLPEGEPTPAAEDPSSAPDDGLLAGRLRVRLEGVERRESGRVARLALELELAETRDLTAVLRAQSERVALPAGARRPVIEALVDHTTRRGTGSALWDLERGGLLELELECETRQVQTTRTRIALGKREGALERATILAGTLSLRMRVE